VSELVIFGIIVCIENMLPAYTTHQVITNTLVDFSS